MQYNKFDALEEQKRQKLNNFNADTLLTIKLNESWAGRRLVEALSQLPPDNLSSSLDMKFQRKQMLEREQKKLALTGGVTTTSDTSIPSKTNIGNGKVRQMFDDRRRGVGIDRSHPLRPIMSSTNSTSVTARTSIQQTSTNSRLTGGANVSRRTIAANSTLKKSQTATTQSSLNNSYCTNNGTGSGNVFNNNLDELDNLDNETFPKEFSSLSLNDTNIMGSRITADRDINDNSNDESSILGGTIVINKKPSSKTNGIKLNPVITKKSPTATAAKANVQNNRTAGNTNKVSPSKSPTSTARTPMQKTATPQTIKGVKTTATKTNTSKPATFVLSVKPPPRISTPPPGMASCQFCQRHFNEERLSKHEEVCRKMTSKKRKIFDASKHRVKGTEAEKYLRKGKGSVISAPKQTTTTVVTTKSQGSAEKKSSWRKKHEEFIAAIREAKKVQAHLAKGGKLSDLPPPPPSENPDYVQCPHCGRRFNESAAERHIPKCANMQHNKPKPHGTNTQRKRF